MKKLVRNAIWLLVIMSVTSALAWGWQMGLSVLAGGLLSLVNFHWMRAGVGRLLEGATGTRGMGNPWKTAASYLGRLLLISLVLFAMIHSSFLSLIGGLAGFSIFVLAGMLEAIWLVFKAS